MTTTATKTYEIISQNEVVGQAPGTSRMAALKTFREDALNGDGELFIAPAGARLMTTDPGDGTQTYYRAEPREDDEAADLENGPSAADATDAFLAGQDDERYTQEAIWNYSDELLAEHLEERTAQRAACKVGMQRYHALLETIADPDSKLATDTLANLGSVTREHAIQNRVIRQLERETSRRRAEAASFTEAKPNEPNVELVNQETAKRGLPVDVDETGDTDMVNTMWFQATLAIEAEGDNLPTQAEVASRVADAYSVLYGYDAIAKHQTGEDVIAAQADADALAQNSGTPIGADITNALLVCITDPAIRIHLDPKALEQARTALGLA